MRRKFRRKDINCAILMTLADLDGYNHPLGFKCKKGEDLKGFFFIPGILLSFSAGYYGTDDYRARGFDYSTDNSASLANACKVFAKSCSEVQRQAVISLLKIIRKEALERRKSGENKGPYFCGFSKNNRWGRQMKALAKAFEVKLR